MRRRNGDVVMDNDRNGRRGETSAELLAIVPARGGSKRLRRKNLRALGGLSLMARTDRALREGAPGTPCLLSTDDAEIADAGRALGWQVPLLRPPDLAQDATPTLPAVLHALDWWRADKGADPDWLLLLQVTSPFRTSAVIARALDQSRDRAGLNAVLGVTALHRSPADIHRCRRDQTLEPLGTRDDTRVLYTPNGTLYLIRSKSLRDTRCWAPPGTAPLATGPIESLDIDTEEDWQLCRAIVDAGLDPFRAARSEAQQ